MGRNIVDINPVGTNAKRTLLIPVYDEVPPDTTLNGALIYVRADNTLYFWRETPTRGWTRLGFNPVYSFAPTPVVGASLIDDGVGPLFRIKTLTLSTLPGNTLAMAETANTLVISNSSFYTIVSPITQPAIKVAATVPGLLATQPGPNWTLKTVDSLDGSARILYAPNDLNIRIGSNVDTVAQAMKQDIQLNSQAIPLATVTTIKFNLQKIAASVFIYNNTTGKTTIPSGKPGVYFVTSYVRGRPSEFATKVWAFSVDYSIWAQIGSGAPFTIGAQKGTQGIWGGDNDSPMFYQCEGPLFLDGTQVTTIWATFTYWVNTTLSYTFTVTEGSFMASRLTYNAPPAN